MSLDTGQLGRSSQPKLRIHAGIRHDLAQVVNADKSLKTLTLPSPASINPNLN
jgi:hypothetical protein